MNFSLSAARSAALKLKFILQISNACFDLTRRQEGRQEGKREEVESLLAAKFGEVDPELASMMGQLMQLSAVDRARLGLQLSREELMAHFQQSEQIE